MFRVTKMANKTPAYQIKAVKKYNSKFHELKLRFLPEEYSTIVSHAQEHGDKSTSAFIKRAIQETMDSDNKGES